MTAVGAPMVFVIDDDAAVRASIQGLLKGSQYALTWDMVDQKSRMLHIPRTKNEETTHALLNNVALPALKAVLRHVDGKGRVFRSLKTGEPLENGRHWSDDAVVAAQLKNIHWHDLRHPFASRLQMKGVPLEDMADLPGRKSLRMARRHAHPGTNKPHAVASLLEARGTRTDTGHSEGQTATAQEQVH